MKKSYHSIVVPIVDAITALRNCLLCSDADNPLCGVVLNVTVLAIVFPSVPHLGAATAAFCHWFSSVTIHSSSSSQSSAHGCAAYRNGMVRTPIETAIANRDLMLKTRLMRRIEPMSYDPAKAKELLAEAGYPSGIDT